MLLVFIHLFISLLFFLRIREFSFQEANITFKKYLLFQLLKDSNSILWFHFILFSIFNRKLWVRDLRTCFMSFKIFFFFICYFFSLFLTLYNLRYKENIFDSSDCYLQSRYCLTSNIYNIKLHKLQWYLKNEKQ